MGCVREQLVLQLRGLLGLELQAFDAHDPCVALPDGFVLVPEIFDPASAAAHLEGLLAEVGWDEERFTSYGRTMPMPRLIAMYGPVGYRAAAGADHTALPSDEKSDS